MAALNYIMIFFADSLFLQKICCRCILKQKNWDVGVIEAHQHLLRVFKFTCLNFLDSGRLIVI